MSGINYLNAYWRDNFISDLAIGKLQRLIKVGKFLATGNRREGAGVR